MNRFFAGVLLLSLLLACACQPAKTENGTIMVMAAASLTEPFTALADRYQELHPGLKIVLNFAGSQALANQIVQGAPGDIFASANLKYMQQMQDQGFVAPDSSRIFAYNELVVVIPKSNPANLSTLADLAGTALKIVLAAEEVPVGSYTRQFLSLADAQLRADYRARFMKNVVSNEDNVKSVLTKVSLGEADAGIVYSSDAVGAAGSVLTITIPSELNVRAEYPLAVLKESANPRAAADFVDYILSSDGQAVLAQFGFTSAITN
jgi:molybdate transport system substrate-binding protein